MALRVVGMHVGRKQSSSAVGRALTIAELTGKCQLLAPQPSVPGQQSAWSRMHSTHSTHTVNSKSRSGPRHGRTVVQMLQNSLVQKALSQELVASSSSSNCIKVAVSQTSELLMAIHYPLIGSALRDGCCLLMAVDTSCTCTLHLFAFPFIFLTLPSVLCIQLIV